MLIFQPALLLLGLVVHALDAFFQGRDLPGAVYFVGALCLQQMAL